MQCGHADRDWRRWRDGGCRFCGRHCDALVNGGQSNDGHHRRCDGRHGLVQPQAAADINISATAKAEAGFVESDKLGHDGRSNGTDGQFQAVEVARQGVVFVALLFGLGGWGYGRAQARSRALKSERPQITASHDAPCVSPMLCSILLSFQSVELWLSPHDVSLCGMPKKNVPREPRRALSEVEVRTHFNDEVLRLRRLTEMYDAGEPYWLPLIAVSLRKLFHESGQSNSLLAQLGWVDSIQFPDTRHPWSGGGVQCYVGLACLLQEPGNIRFGALFDSELGRFVDFKTWWDCRIFDDPQGREPFNRSSLVLAIADQEGAHCDPKITESYARIKNDSPFGMQCSDMESMKIGDEVRMRPIDGATDASLRQIAHETLKAFVQGYTKPAPANMYGILPNIQLIFKDD